MALFKRGKIGSRSLDKALAGGVPLPTYTVAQLTTLTPAKGKGMLVFCSNGAGGSPCLAYSDGASWKQVALGNAVAAA